MATSTLRAAIIVAALVFGGIVLANAFPGGDTSGPSTNVTTTSPTSTASPTTPPTTPPPVLEGALLQVLNGSGMDGLATAVATCLREQGGADIPADTHVGNAPERFETTQLVFQPDRRALAELLRTRFFPGARLQAFEGDDEPTPPNEVTVIVGEDYAPVAECQG